MLTQKSTDNIIHEYDRIYEVCLIIKRENVSHFFSLNQKVMAKRLKIKESKSGDAF